MRSARTIGSIRTAAVPNQLEHCVIYNNLSSKLLTGSAEFHLSRLLTY